MLPELRCGRAASRALKFDPDRIAAGIASERARHRPRTRLLSWPQPTTRPGTGTVASASPLPPPDGPSGAALLPASIAVYGAMTAAGVVLGRNYEVGSQLLSPLDVPAAVLYLAPLLGLFALSTAMAEFLPAFQELKDLFEKKLVPELQRYPPWALAVMAGSAGVGEETLFRGALQTWLVASASQVPDTSPENAAAVGVLLSSVVFGALHALNPAYFVFASAAGVVFGVEHINAGLPAAAATHGIYDFIAFLATIKMWGNKLDNS